MTSPPGSRAASGPANSDAILAAMADPTRRLLLTALGATGQATATELARGLPISRQAVAKHLAVLADAGLVSRSRPGRDVRLRVDAAGLAATAEWLAALAADWDVRLAAIRRIAEAGA
jgi:DNA-binding transcriptional ArsR family regulator